MLHIDRTMHSLTCVACSKIYFIFRGRKALENRQNLDDDRISTLERMVKESTVAAEVAGQKYEEVNTVLCAICIICCALTRDQNFEIRTSWDQISTFYSLPSNMKSLKRVCEISM